MTEGTPKGDLVELCERSVFDFGPLLVLRTLI